MQNFIWMFVEAGHALPISHHSVVKVCFLEWLLTDGTRVNIVGSYTDPMIGVLDVVDDWNRMTRAVVTDLTLAL